MNEYGSAAVNWADAWTNWLVSVKVPALFF